MVVFTIGLIVGAMAHCLWAVSWMGTVAAALQESVTEPQPDPRYWLDMREHHNGYDPDMRADMPSLREPVDAVDALHDLLEQEAGEAVEDYLREQRARGNRWVGVAS
jgi:hypothetical protein